jgi:hypothetical protein
MVAVATGTTEACMHILKTTTDVAVPTEDEILELYRDLDTDYSELR